MWARKYKDYPPDSPLIQQQVEPNKGIIGCEMHDLLGWGEEYHVPAVREKPGVFQRLWRRIWR